MQIFCLCALGPRWSCFMKNRSWSHASVQLNKKCYVEFVWFIYLIEHSFLARWHSNNKIYISIFHITCNRDRILFAFKSYGLLHTFILHHIILFFFYPIITSTGRFGIDDKFFHNIQENTTTYFLIFIKTNCFPNTRFNQGWASVLFKRTFRSLRSFLFFIKEQNNLCILFRSL